MKKAVITAFDVNTARKAGQTSIAVPDNALITPQAADDARAYGIALTRNAQASQQASQQLPAQVSRQVSRQLSRLVPHQVPQQARPAITPPTIPMTNPAANPAANPTALGHSSGVPHPQTHQGAEMAEEVRRQVMARLGNAAPASLDFVISSVMAQTAVSSGTTAPNGERAETSFIRKAGAVRLVSSAALPRENSGTGPSAVNMVEAVPPDTAHPGVTYLCWENSSFAWTFRHDEVLVVLEGDVTLALDGITHAGAALAGKPGDTFLIPAQSAVTISAKGKARCVHSSWPNPATAKG